MPDTDHAARQPAEPVLASVLLQHELNSKQLFADRDETISTGCGEVDDHVLLGGLDRGIVVGVNGEDNAGRLFTYHTIASVVLSHISSTTPPSRKALVIDVSGNFSVQLLSNIIRAKLLAIEREKALSRVTTGNFPAGGQKSAPSNADVDEKVVRCLQMVDIDTVFDITGLWEVLGGTDEEGKKSIGAETEILLIDNIGILISSLLSNSKSEAFEITATLSKALLRLSRNANILTLLRTVALFNTTQPDKHPTPHLTSLFTSNTTKPALGKLFDNLTDLHLLLGSVPESSGELITVIEVLKDETPNLGTTHRRFGAREQRWAPLKIAPDGLGFVPAFRQGEGRGAKLDMERPWHMRHR